MSVNQRAVKAHRDLYKCKTPPWKETYRKRCMDRLKESREKLQARFRNMGSCDSNKVEDDESFIRNLMREELKGFQTTDCGVDESQTDIDNMLSLFEDIQEELKMEEMKLLEESENFKKSLELVEASLCSAIEKLSTEEVFCPVCQKNQLLKNKSVIFCQCGMRVDTEQDCLTLADVKKIVEAAVTEHSAGCEEDASFSVVQALGNSNLLMSCQMCDWMSIII